MHSFQFHKYFLNVKTDCSKGEQRQKEGGQEGAEQMGGGAHCACRFSSPFLAVELWPVF